MQCTPCDSEIRTTFFLKEKGKAGIKHSDTQMAVSKSTEKDLCLI